MAKTSLHKRESDFANANKQLEFLSNGIFANDDLPTFVLPIITTVFFMKTINQLFNKTINHTAFGLIKKST